ncbi:hypothetical protein Tsubulata_015823 [Turnera subulata]|uniref:Metal-nicotianamine transporter YSL7 n=1 Tax=Turnera subulata TaxID=218843 RepID=A0A9Q0F0C7_9ROSI|nr:hypothetical protein Tsubulata_015823 [Turnera subulata]
MERRRSPERVGENPFGDKNYGEEEAEEVGNTVMIEDAYKNTAVPPWDKQITIRAVVTSLVLSVVFNFIVCKLNLTTGVIPSLNVAAGLLGFAILKFWTTVLGKAGLLRQPFTRQENTVVQTCVVASSGIAFSSGTASYLLGMSPKIADQADGGVTPLNVKELHLGWITGFLFVVSFVGLFSVVSLRKMMILKYKLTYPSGTATAYLINSFHTPRGAQLAKKQVAVLFKYFSVSFVWAFFQWFWTAGDDCGFANMPFFGPQAFAKKFYFDFSSTYVGVGMICPSMVNISLLIGAILSWGIMWPAIEAKKGIWYSASVSGSSLHGIQGYRIFIAIATMLGDGLFHVLYMLLKTSVDMWKQKVGKKDASSINPATAAFFINVIQEVLRRTEKKYGIYRFIPSPMCMAIPFYLGGYFAIDMCVGSLIIFLWKKFGDKQRATDFCPAVASGLICGDSLWGIPAAILSLAKVNPPMCIRFLTAADYTKVNGLLQ